MLQADAVFEGGGVKGIGLVGALAETEAQGYEFVNVAGTSAGAIVASLLAAGYTSAELQELLSSTVYRQFEDGNLLSKIPLLGPTASILFSQGIYRGDFLERWLGTLLKAKGVTHFGDLVIPEFRHNQRYRYKLRVIASDISRGKLLVLPQDSTDYGITPDRLEVAKAVRMSMSIPYFFRPVILGGNYIVDGGILSNFPVWLFDEETDDPSWPTFGYKIVDPQEGQKNKVNGAASLFKALFSTMMEAHDARYIEDHNFARTIPVPSLGIKTTDFSITAREREALYRSGRLAAQQFFKEWDFEEYKRKFKGKASGNRKQEIWHGQN